MIWRKRQGRSGIGGRHKQWAGSGLKKIQGRSCSHIHTPGNCATRFKKPTFLSLEVVPRTVQTDKPVMSVQLFTCQTYLAIAQNPQPPGLSIIAIPSKKYFTLRGNNLPRIMLAGAQNQKQ